MADFSAYQIPLKTLAPGEYNYSYHLDKQFFVDNESTDIRNGDVDVKLTVRYDGDLYYLDFVMHGTVTVACDRCLDNLELPVDTDYHFMVKLGDSYRDDSDELLEIPASAPHLNVACMIYDTVALTVPLKHVHPAGQCNRAMSALFKRHRVNDANDPDSELEQTLIDQIDDIDNEPEATNDPRWDALKGLKTDNQDNNE